MRRTLTALLLSAGAVLASAPAANAVTSVDVQCESGGNQFYCFAYHDAVAPYTVKWYLNGSYVASLDNRTFIGRRGCSGGRTVSVQAVVADATGSVTGTGGVYCNSGPWP